MTLLFTGHENTVAPPDPAVGEALTRSWAALGEPGTWWSGPERLAIAVQARAARSCEVCEARQAAVTPYAIEQTHEPVGELPAPVVDAVHRITSDPGRLSSRWRAEVRDAGISDGELVEITAVISTVVSVDTVARGLGHDLPVLPEPSGGSPTRYVPDGLESDVAWVPTVAPEAATEAMREYYESVASSGTIANVFRALTLVPDEALRHRDRAVALYPPARDILDTTKSSDLTRPQIELIAATVSAANDCFY